MPPPADDARDTDDECGDEGCGENDDGAVTSDSNVHRRRLLLAHAEDVDTPAIEKKKGQCCKIRGQDEQQPVKLDTCERAHEPVDDLRQFFLRAGGKLHEGLLHAVRKLRATAPVPAVTCAVPHG